MRIINHLIAADLRRHRLLLTAWLAIVVATAALAGARPLLAAGDVGPSVSILSSLLSLTQFLLLIVLIATVVQTHPAVGSDAFWMTRPIPPGALLVAKLVLLGGATIVIPMVTEAILMAANAVPAAQIAAVAAQTAVYNLLWLMLLATAAALTPSLTRFALLCGGALVAIALLLTGTLAISMATLEDTPPTSGDGGPGDPTSTIVFMLLVIAAGLALLIVQYREQNRAGDPLRSVQQSSRLRTSRRQPGHGPSSLPDSRSRRGPLQRPHCASTQMPGRCGSTKSRHRSRGGRHGDWRERASG